MRTKKKLLVAGGLIAALAVPAGVAVAATDPPTADDPPAAEPGFGPHGRLMGGAGDREECPFYDSEAMQEWPQHRQDREQHREQMREHMRAQFDDTR